ncbi:MAG: CoA-binding protein [Planctomycetes bacterium]|jgi:predicted CoA-binding protein|nr:CoA-binding protein [Planctomycetota bacterium]
MNPTEKIDAFLSGTSFAVAGASTDRAKYGNRVLRAYLERKMPVTPIHPREKEIEGIPTVRDVASLPEGVHGLSIVTPPLFTETVVDQAISKGIRHLWMQPGAESEGAISRATAAGCVVIHGGACVLVELPKRR